jgi:molybdopterin converting factor subunit 1
MIVRVRLFAVAKELAGRDELAIEVLSGSRIADVRRALAATYPSLETVVSHALWAVDAEYANETTPVNATSNVALIPPVSGG